jgi:ankyrin repeat protein
MTAAWLREPEIARLLLDQGVLVNAKAYNGETALMRSSYKGSEGMMVKMLLDAGADANARTDAGMTALIAAAMAGDAASAEKLLKAGADPAVKDKYGRTAEDDACDRGEKGHYQVCLLLRHALGKN